jgi:hypothetical protein
MVTLALGFLLRIAGGLRAMGPKTYYKYGEGVVCFVWLPRKETRKTCAVASIEPLQIGSIFSFIKGHEQERRKIPSEG